MTPGRRLLYVVGARSSAATIAPVLAELRKRLPQARHGLVHAGREPIPDELRAELRLPPPDYRLDVSPGSPISQTTAMMERIERVIEVERPNLVLLADDSAPTLAAALTAMKLYIPTARLDAGLRTFDRDTSDEINRVIMDAFADLLFVSCNQAAVNLRVEGIDPARIHLVGSTTTDALIELQPRIGAAHAARRLGLEHGRYLLVLLRESTLLDTARLRPVLARLGELGAELPVILPAPAHSSRAWADRLACPGVRILRPIGYVDQLSLESEAASVITDAGYVQDETAFLGVPCLTLLEKTERIASVEGGTNVAIGREPPSLRQVREAVENVRQHPATRPRLWDGQASQRLAKVIAARLSRQDDAAPLSSNAMLS